MERLLERNGWHGCVLSSLVPGSVPLCATFGQMSSAIISGQPKPC